MSKATAPGFERFFEAFYEYVPENLIDNSPLMHWLKPDVVAATMQVDVKQVDVGDPSRKQVEVELTIPFPAPDDDIYDLGEDNVDRDAAFSTGTCDSVYLVHPERYEEEIADILGEQSFAHDPDELEVFGFEDIIDKYHVTVTYCALDCRDLQAHIKYERRTHDYPGSETWEISGEIALYVTMRVDAAIERPEVMESLDDYPDVKNGRINGGKYSWPIDTDDEADSDYISDYYADHEEEVIPLEERPVTDDDGNRCTLQYCLLPNEHLYRVILCCGDSCRVIFEGISADNAYDAYESYDAGYDEEDYIEEPDDPIDYDYVDDYADSKDLGEGLRDFFRREKAEDNKVDCPFAIEVFDGHGHYITPACMDGPYSKAARFKTREDAEQFLEINGLHETDSMAIVNVYDN